MDSLKMFKGYGKVEDNPHLEDQQQPKPPHSKISKSLITTISLFSILFLTLTLALTFALIHHTNTESPESSNSAAESIRVICNVTRFRDSCISSMNTTILQNPIDPEAILKLSLRVSINELTKFASLLSSSNGSAISDCKEQVDDSVSRLSDSLAALQAAEVTEAKISDVKTWVSAAMTDQQTCIDGLEEMGSGDVADVKRKMQRAMEYTSNSLAIAANLKYLLKRFHMSLH